MTDDRQGLFPLFLAVGLLFLLALAVFIFTVPMFECPYAAFKVRHVGEWHCGECKDTDRVTLFRRWTLPRVTGLK